MNYLRVDNMTGKIHVYDDSSMIGIVCKKLQDSMR